MKAFGSLHFKVCHQIHSQGSEMGRTRGSRSTICESRNGTLGIHVGANKHSKNFGMLKNGNSKTLLSRGIWGSRLDATGQNWRNKTKKCLQNKTYKDRESNTCVIARGKAYLFPRHRQAIRNYGAIVAGNPANSSCDSACDPSGLPCCSGCYLRLLVELSAPAML